MAGFATDTGFGPTGCVTRVFRIEVFTHVGRVTLDTTAVCIRQMPGPVKRVLGIDILVGLQVIPAPSALFFTAAIPGEVQRLQMTLADIDQVLLQRIVSEGVVDLKDARLSVPTCRRHHEISALAEKARFDAMEYNRGVIEITQHGFFVRALHGTMVIRQLPLRVFGLMTVNTLIGTDIGRSEIGRLRNGTREPDNQGGLPKKSFRKRRAVRS